MSPSEIKKQFALSLDSVTVIKVNYRSIERLFDQVFKTTHKEGFHLPCIEERGNGEDWEVDVSKEVRDEYDLEELEEVKSGSWPQFCTDTLLTECCNRGIIPEGNYLIDISW